MRLIELDQAGSNRWEGNYWEEYRGLDMDGDGFGDAPFTTGDPLGMLTTDYPQLKLFRYSPAVQALEAGERAFPVLELPAITDARPALQPVAQASGALPALPVAPRGGRFALVLFSLACALSALALMRLGRRITLRRPTTDDPINTAQSRRRPTINRTEHANGLSPCHLVILSSCQAEPEAGHD
jgi:hypothetical protein